LPPESAQLGALQEWMQTSLLSDACVDASTHVLGSERLSAAARLGIYAQAYRQRLFECLQLEYPMLAELAGPTAFALFAQGYIAAHPSHSYTLYDYGAGFADYLERARPSGPADAVEAIPAALARIERARAEVLRAHGVERLGRDATFDPIVTALCGPRLWRPDSVRLLALPFDFTATLAAIARREAPPLPVPAKTLLAVARANYRVDCHRLEPWQHAWLKALPASCEPVPLAAVDPRVAAWLSGAVRCGLVALH
jgi:hypothetical protein